MPNTKELLLDMVIEAIIEEDFDQFDEMLALAAA